MTRSGDGPTGLGLGVMKDGTGVSKSTVMTFVKKHGKIPESVVEAKVDYFFEYVLPEIRLRH